MINSFTHRCVRDLAWVVASPPLVSGLFNNDGHQTHWWDHVKCSQELDDCLPALQALDENPQALVDHLKRVKSKRLGLRFEALVSFWLASISPNFRLLAQNIQLNKIAGDTRSRTIGEVDFVVEEVGSEKVIHLEVAVKFYLGTAPYDDAYRWFGTNTQDQLGKKVDHLQHYQTQLLLQHAAHIPFSIDERHCLFKGRLFYPSHLSSIYVQSVAPEYVTNNHLRGSYVFYNERIGVSKRLVQLEKSEWLAGLTHKDITQRKTQSTLIHFIQEERASCYAIIEKDKKGMSEEVERVFCLPETFVFPKVDTS